MNNVAMQKACNLQQMASARSDAGEFDSAVQCATQAIELLDNELMKEGPRLATSPPDSEGTALLADLWAEKADALGCRAIALRQIGNFEAANRDFAKAANILRGPGNHPSGRLLNEKLATLLHNYGIFHLVRSNLKDAHAAFDECIEIRTHLIRYENFRHVLNELAGTIASRSSIWAKTGEMDLAIKDLNIAVDIRRKLVVIEEIFQHRQIFGRTLTSRAKLHRIFRLSDPDFRRALADIDEAVSILRVLYETEGQEMSGPDLAAALAERTLCRLGAGMRSGDQSALADAHASASLFNKLIASGWGGVKSDFLGFLANAAAPAAYMNDPPDYSGAVAFIDAGEQIVEDWLESNRMPPSLKHSVDLFFGCIPLNIRRDLVQYGFNLQTHEALAKRASAAH